MFPPDQEVIDCPPQLGLLTVNSFVASDALLLCCQMSNLAVEGVMYLISSYNMLKENMDYSSNAQKLFILGIVATFYDARNSTVNKEIMNILMEGFSDRLFSTKIRLDLDLNKSQGVGQFRIMSVELYHFASISWYSARSRFAAAWDVTFSDFCISFFPS